MKNKWKKLFALLLGLILCMNLTGCEFVLLEERVLLDSGDQVPDSSKDNTDVAKGDDSGEQGDVTNTDNTQNNETPGTEQTDTPAAPSSTNTEPKLSGSLEIQIFTNENEEVGNAWTSIIDAFEAKTGVKVTAYIGSQVNTQFTKRWMGSNPPDIALLAGSGIPDIALEQSGLLYDLTDVLKNGYVYGTNEKIWDVTSAKMYQQSSETAAYYRAGVYASACGIFWDQAYLSQLGLSAPKNYTELLSFVDSARSKGVAVFTTNGSTGNYATQSMVMPALAAYDQSFYEGICLGKKSAWGSQNVRDVFQRWYDFCRGDGTILTGTSTLDHTTSQMKWLNHNTLLIGNGIWLPWEVENNTPSSFQMEYATSPLILADQAATVEVQPTGMIVAKQAKNLENAKAFVRFLYTKESQELLVGAQGYLGARTDLNYDTISMDAVSRKILKYISGGNVQVRYRNYIWGDLNEEINAAVHGLMTGEMNVDQAVKKITDKAK